MEERLVKAARDGDINTLQNLLKEDPQIVEKACEVHFSDSPLHISARSGKSEFVKQIVTLIPSLATETNGQGRIPLHLASSKGYVETVRELLKAKLELEDGVMNHQCLVKDEQGWTPLHCATQKGKIGVIEELIRVCPESLEQVTAKEETVLHIAVKANQFGAVKVLADSIKRHNFPTIFKAQDQKGKTAYQLAAAKKHLQAVEILKEQDGERREEHRINVESESLEAGREEESSKEGESQQNAILVVAALIITLTYQSMANPPSSFVHDNGSTITRNNQYSMANPPSTFDYGSVFSFKDDALQWVLAFLFMIFNSWIFLQSIYVVVTTLRGPLVFPVRVLTMFLMLCYSILLANFCSNTIYQAGMSYVVLGISLMASYILARQNFFVGCTTSL